MQPLLASTLIAFVTSAAGRAIHGPFQSTTVTSLLSALQLRDDLQVNSTDAIVDVAADDDPPDDPWLLGLDGGEEAQGRTPEQQEALWCKAKSRGLKLIKAMMLNEQEVATMLSWPYVQSPWDGDLKPELRKWGYLDDEGKHKENDNQCDFDKTHEMANAFKDLDVDPRSAGTGGPNHCFYVEHKDGPTVIRDENGELPFEEDQYYMADNKKYQVTQAYAKIGINPTDGIVYFLHRESPESAATEYWGREPKSDELPELRASSDIAWGFWNRVAVDSKKLSYFMSVQITNPETEVILKRALQQYNINTVPAWPGKDFEFVIPNNKPQQPQLLEMEAALALLGSPNGLGAGYFIIQHRRQLGWKYIWKVKIWMAGQGEWALPNILFYVSDRATFEGPDPQRRLDEQLEQLHVAQRQKRNLDEVREAAGIVYESEDGRNVVREHFVITKL